MLAPVIAAWVEPTVELRASDRRSVIRIAPGGQNRLLATLVDPSSLESPRQQPRQGFGSYRMYLCDYQY